MSHFSFCLIFPKKLSASVASGGEQFPPALYQGGKALKLSTLHSLESFPGWFAMPGWGQMWVIAGKDYRKLVPILAHVVNLCGNWRWQRASYYKTKTTYILILRAPGFLTISDTSNIEPAASFLSFLHIHSVMDFKNL